MQSQSAYANNPLYLCMYMQRYKYDLRNNPLYLCTQTFAVRIMSCQWSHVHGYATDGHTVDNFVQSLTHGDQDPLTRPVMVALDVYLPC